MHELSIAVGIVDAVIAEAEARGLAHVTSVRVRLGPLSGVDRDALLFSFPLACDGTMLQGAELLIEDIPVIVHCGSCGAEEAAASFQQLTCPRCGSATTRLVSGNELELRAFEAEEVTT